VSRRAQTRTILAHTSQLRRAVSLLPAPTAPALVLCNSSSIPSPRHRFFAWQGAEDDGERMVWFILSLLLQPDRWQTRAYSSVAVQLHWHPERHAVLHASVSVHRHPSSYFPCLPSVTRFGAYPAPCGTARLCFGLSAALRVSAFRKSLCNERKRFSEPSEKAPLGTWERGTSRRFAQECPEGNPGKYKQGETQWHSTKTTSS
jgi:hypothetical protein